MNGNCWSLASSCWRRSEPVVCRTWWGSGLEPSTHAQATAASVAESCAASCAPSCLGNSLLVASESSVTEMSNEYGGSGPEPSTHAQATAASAAERCALNFGPSCLIGASESRKTEMDSEYGVSEPEPITHCSCAEGLGVMFIFSSCILSEYIYLMSFSLSLFIYISDWT